MSKCGDRPQTLRQPKGRNFPGGTSGDPLGMGRNISCRDKISLDVGRFSHQIARTFGRKYRHLQDREALYYHSIILKTLALVTVSILVQLANAADLQPPTGRFLLATHTDGGSSDVTTAKLDKQDGSPPTIAFKFLGFDWNGSMLFRTIATRVIRPGSKEPYSYLAFDGVLTTKEGSRTVAMSGTIDENGVFRGKMVYLIGIGVSPGGNQEPTAGTGTFVMRPEQAEQAGAGQPATKPADKPPVKGEPSTPTPKDLPR